MRLTLDPPRQTNLHFAGPRRKTPLLDLVPDAAVQRLAAEEPVGPTQIQEAARLGTQGAAGSLPFLSTIQRSFGRHDVSNVKAHTDGFAQLGSEQMFARAFARGDHVAFSKQPSLHQAAHEAAHVVQQRSGLTLPGGVGAIGDAHERHADAVADAVVQGRPSESLLNQYPSRGRFTHTQSLNAPVQGDWTPEWVKKLQRERAIANQAPRGPWFSKNLKWGGTDVGEKSKSLAKWNPVPGKTVKLKNDDPLTAGEDDRNFLLQLFEGRNQKGRVNINYDHALKELKPDSMQASGGYGQGNGALLGKELIKAMLLPEVRSQTLGADHLKLNCVNPLSAHIAIKELNLKWTSGTDQVEPAATTAANTAVEGIRKDEDLVKPNGETKYGYRVAQFATMWGRMANLALNHGVVFTSGELTFDATTDFGGDAVAMILLNYIAASGRVRGGGKFAIDIRSPIPP